MSNRALMLEAWSGGKVQAAHLSEAGDSRLLQALLKNPQQESYDAEDAGTAFRFLSSWLAFNGKTCSLTGSARMKERPVGDLVEALRQLGCRVEYGEKEGFPPLRFSGCAYSGIPEISISRKTSSQFISSLMMAAPSLPEGLHIRMDGGGGSFPYLELTAGMMQDCGLEVHLNSQEVLIPKQDWKTARLSVESDWSSASYFYAILAQLPPGSSFSFPGLRLRSRQGDRVMAHIAENFGIQTEEYPEGIRAIRKAAFGDRQKWSYDFRDCPDLALTAICCGAAQGIRSEFSGLSSLKIKESSRLEAIQTELEKVGKRLQISDNGDRIMLEEGLPSWPLEAPVFDSHKDHRIAMALSILLAGIPGRSASFSHPGVVKKSFPEFWKQLSAAGFQLEASGS